MGFPQDDLRATDAQLKSFDSAHAGLLNYNPLVLTATPVARDNYISPETQAYAREQTQNEKN